MPQNTSRFLRIGLLLSVVFLGCLLGNDEIKHLDKADTFIKTINAYLRGAGALIMTLSIMWSGYKIMFQGKTFQEVAPIFIGGLLIGVAAALAGILLPDGGGGK